MLFLGLALGGLDIFPARLLGRAAGLGGLVAKDVRVAANQLVRHGLGHVLQPEMPGLFSHARVEDHLEQQIAQFDPQLVHVAVLDGVGDLIGFLNRIGSDRLEGLLHVPGTAAVRIAQANHDVLQAVDGVGHSGVSGVSLRQGGADFVMPLRRQGIALQHPGGGRQ